MRIFRFVLIFILSGLPIFSQVPEVENIGKSTKIYSVEGALFFHSPMGLIVDEVKQEFLLTNPVNHIEWVYKISQNEEVMSSRLRHEILHFSYVLGDFIFTTTGGSVKVIQSSRERHEAVVYYETGSKHVSGFCFFLKKDIGYIAFLLNDQGYPVAVDSDGKYYPPQEAMDYLKGFDLSKYEESRLTSRGLGIEDSFQSNQALVWGQNYFVLPREINNKSGRIVISRVNYPLQYDMDGNSYIFSSGYTPEDPKELVIILQGFQSLRLDRKKNSEILASSDPNTTSYSEIHVGFGGNVYFYVAGDEYTEFFRIRRTWGEPNFYAMAVNGYTEDNYGKYVDSVLEKLDGTQLRLLRNYLFALYGYRFNSADLSRYFDRQVWYRADPSLAIGDITLPPERQALLEKIQGWERRRGR